ncbi:unknown [Eubacterium sp. CAG:115]|nr:unknown [Eubacterium sp. CAG:115]
MRRVVNAFLGGVGNCYLNLGILGRELSVSAVKSACRNLFVRHGYDFSMAAVVGDRQLAAREVKSLVVFIVCPGLLADCNGVDIIGAAIYLLLKLDWSVQEFNVIRFDISLQLDCLRLVRIGVKAQNLVVNHLCNYVPAAVRAVDPNPAEKRGIVCNGAVHIGVSNVRNRNAFIAGGIVERIKDIFGAFKIALVYWGKISDELRLASCDDPQLIGKRYGQFVVNAVKRNLSFVDPVIKSNGRTAYKFVLVDRALG